jgi:hypothetical protein
MLRYGFIADSLLQFTSGSNFWFLDSGRAVRWRRARGLLFSLLPPPFSVFPSRRRTEELKGETPNA